MQHVGWRSATLYCIKRLILSLLTALLSARLRFVFALFDQPTALGQTNQALSVAEAAAAADRLVGFDCAPIDAVILRGPTDRPLPGCQVRSRRSTFQLHPWHRLARSLTLSSRSITRPQIVRPSTPPRHTLDTTDRQRRRRQRRRRRRWHPFSRACFRFTVTPRRAL